MAVVDLASIGVALSMSPGGNLPALPPAAGYGLVGVVGGCLAWPAVVVQAKDRFVGAALVAGSTTVQVPFVAGPLLHRSLFAGLGAIALWMVTVLCAVAEWRFQRIRPVRRPDRAGG